MIILGPNLDSPAKFVICWTPEAALSGGTALGMRIAAANGIPIFNLANDEALKRVKGFIK